jgi:alpha-beta hydrolase superfamily lysophospholipase
MSEIATMNENNWEETFVCESPFDKLRLMGRNWPVKEGPTRAVVLIVHGSGEHCQRYRHVAVLFNTHHIACVSFDMRGHGESQGERGFIPRLGALHDDLECIIEYVRSELYSNIPLVIYSHGTGSLICLTHTTQRSAKPLDCHAMIISTPSLCLRKRPTFLLLFLSRTFANLDPHILLPVGGNKRNVYTNDPEVVEAYRNDPFVHDRWPAATVAIIMETALSLKKDAFHPPCPVLVQYGVDDSTTPIQWVRKWMRKKVRGNVQYKEWPGNFHELHNDMNKEEILTFAVRWIEEKLNI